MVQGLDFGATTWDPVSTSMLDRARLPGELPMSWEIRFNTRYYYYKFKINCKVLSLYLGNGRIAELFAGMVEDRRIEAAIERQIEQERLQEWRNRRDAEE